VVAIMAGTGILWIALSIRDWALKCVRGKPATKTVNHVYLLARLICLLIRLLYLQFWISY